MTPNDHISFFIVYVLVCSPSGLMYRGEPTFMVYFGLDPALFAKPKSAILVTLSLMSKLAGFKSLWMKPDSPTWINP
jgi:hypothetical protein